MASPQAQALYEHIIAGDGCEVCSAALIMYGIFCVDCRPEADDRMEAMRALCPDGEKVFIHKKIDVAVAEGKISPFAADVAKQRALAHRSVIITHPGAPDGKLV